jgi:hypothetical protein
MARSGRFSALARYCKILTEDDAELTEEAV